MSVQVKVTSHYGNLSRGRHSARQGNGSAARWASKDGRGNLVIDEPGVYQLHSTDGFNRSARAVLTVHADGSWEMTGDTRRFDVID